MTSRLLPLGIILVMMFPTQTEALFYDVPDDHQYVEAINYVMQKGIVRGYPNRSFRPDITVNRAEFTKMLVKMLFPDNYIDECLENLPPEAEHIKTFDFFDIGNEEWFTPYVCTAWLNGIIGGYPDGSFRPANGVTFVEASKMLAIGFGLTDVELPNLGRTYNTVWYKPYIDIMSHLNAIPPTIVDMDYPLQRADVAEILYRLRKVPIDITPAPQFSQKTEDFVSPVNWIKYTDNKRGFSIKYPNVWAEPTVLTRGSYSYGMPFLESEWKVYLGNVNHPCVGYAICTETDTEIDGYLTQFADDVFASLDSEKHITLLHHQKDENSEVALFEEHGSCTHKVALVRGKNFLYRFRYKCAGDSEEKSHLFDQMIRTMQLVKIYN